MLGVSDDDKMRLVMKVMHAGILDGAEEDARTASRWRRRGSHDDSSRLARAHTLWSDLCLCHLCTCVLLVANSTVPGVARRWGGEGGVEKGCGRFCPVLCFCYCERVSPKKAPPYDIPGAAS
jgi:hypothetical protein